MAFMVTVRPARVAVVLAIDHAGTQAVRQMTSLDLRIALEQELGGTRSWVCTRATLGSDGSLDLSCLSPEHTRRSSHEPCC